MTFIIYSWYLKNKSANYLIWNILVFVYLLFMGSSIVCLSIEIGFEKMNEI